MSAEFDQQYQEYQQLIQEALPSYLPPSDLLQKVVVDAMQYSLMAGGKRVRAVLLLHFCKLCGGSVQEALPFAAAIEMVHAYSLIHDDLPCMDDDDMRRGKPSCHIAFGEANALLAGDGLLTLTFETMLADQNIAALGAGRVLRAAATLANAAGVLGMIGGQVLDLESENQSIDAERLVTIHRLKTGALIRAAAKMGCILAGADDAVIARADSYAENLGLAFQVVDDILDVVADPEVLGKPVGSDDDNHKTTYVTLYGLERSREIVKDYVLAADLAIKGSVLDDSFLYELADMLADREY